MRVSRSAPALMVLALLACGGDDKKVAGPSDAQLAEAQAGCSGEPSQPVACDMLCRHGREASCEQLKNTCLFGSDALACSLLGDTYQREGDGAHAKGAYKLACQGGHDAACDKLGSDGASAPTDSPAPPTTTDAPPVQPPGT